VSSGVQLAQNPAMGAGNILGKYRLIAELGRGGMSEVYLACVSGPAGFNKLSVIKQIKAELAEDPDFVTMFLEEARLAARLSHPNVVQTNEVGHEGQNRYFIAMEYLEGQPYSRVLNRLGRDRGLPLGMSLRVIVDVLAGLHHAHELCDYDGTPLEVVHRDVTPHNVFITYDGQVKVMDFGIAKAMNSSLETRTGVLKGKVGYMAPEQARGERVDRRADIFSVGVMLWEAAVGRRLWKGLAEVTVLHKLLNGEIPRPRQMRPDISDRLETICLRALAVDREYRYGTSAELQADLEELIDGPGMRTSVREIGRMVAQQFAEDRAKLRQIIDSQLSSYQSLNTGLYQQVQLPVVDNPALSQELPIVRPTGDDDSGPAEHSGLSPAAGYPVSGSHPAASVPPASVPHSAHPSSLTAASAPHHPAPQQRSSVIGLVALAVAGLSGGLAALLWIGMGRDADPAGSTETDGSAALSGEEGAPKVDEPPVAEPPIAEPSAAVGETGEGEGEGEPAAALEASMELDVTPKHATITVDGEKIDGRAFSLSLDEDHEIVVEAPGYETTTTTVKIDADAVETVGDEATVLEIQLERVTPGRPYRPPPKKKKAPPDPDDMTVPGTRPTRKLDPNNPYNQ